MNTIATAIWSVLFGSSLIILGGLVLWTYGSKAASSSAPAIGPEAEAVQFFHQRANRWYFIYGASIIGIGAALLLWAGTILLPLQ